MTTNLQILTTATYKLSKEIIECNKLYETVSQNKSLLLMKERILNKVISCQQKGIKVSKFCWTDGFPGMIEGVVGDTIGFHSDIAPARELVKFAKEEMMLEETNWVDFFKEDRK